MGRRFELGQLRQGFTYLGYVLITHNRPSQPGVNDGDLGSYHLADEKVHYDQRLTVPYFFLSRPPRVLPLIYWTAKISVS